MLYIGAENWPFPVPLVSRNGVWRFDPQAGSLEILFRRIGENEMTAIGMCRTPITAEAHPGLDSEADRLVNLLLPHAPQESKPIPIHGYYFPHPCQLGRVCCHRLSRLIPLVPSTRVIDGA